MLLLKLFLFYFKSFRTVRLLPLLVLVLFILLLVFPLDCYYYCCSFPRTDSVQKYVSKSYRKSLVSLSSVVSETARVPSMINSSNPF